MRPSPLAPELVELLGSLRHREGRAAAARAIAHRLGAEDFLIFIRDAELGLLLPAQGFPQTLPDGRQWRRFLGRCVEEGQCRDELSAPGGKGRVPAHGWAGGEAVMVFLGGEPLPGEVASIGLLLPLLGGVFQGEMAEVRADGHAAAARQVAQHAEALAQALDSARRELEEALREAREGDRRKDEFLAMLGHELRNPLAPLLNAVEVMRELGSQNPTLQRSLTVIERQIQSLTRLVDQLLDVSRITRGKIELRRVPVALGRAIGDAVETSRPLIESHGHALTVTLPDEPLWLDADAARLEQVLSNLLNNAAKYTPDGGRIWLSARREAGEAVVCVRDTGRGIAPELLPRIFDPFVQDDRTLDRAQGGLGLGLTLVRDLVRMHGGTVTANSGGPGQGSEFVLRLPVRVGLPPASTLEVTAARPSRTDALRVLVVDDNRDAADTLADLLRLWGHVVVGVAYDGPSALECASRHCPEVVLLDIGLPGMDGYQVARRLRAQLPSHVLLIALTGYGQADDRRSARDAGFDVHLTKPVDPGALKAALFRANPRASEAPAAGM